jgi:predicted permease
MRVAMAAAPYLRWLKESRAFVQCDSAQIRRDMGDINFLAVVLAAVAFFVVGAVWYGLLFVKPWQREAAVTEPPRGSAVPRIMILTFLAELLVCFMLGHLIARLNPPPHVIMMFAVGFGVTIMTPALAINYLHQRKSLTLFAIDAGHLILGMTAAGLVFFALA